MKFMTLLFLFFILLASFEASSHEAVEQENDQAIELSYNDCDGHDDFHSQNLNCDEDCCDDCDCGCFIHHYAKIDIQEFNFQTVNAPRLHIIAILRVSQQQPSSPFRPPILS